MDEIAKEYNTDNYYYYIFAQKFKQDSEKNNYLNNLNIFSKFH